MSNRRRNQSQLRGGPIAGLLLVASLVLCVTLYFLHIHNRMLALGNVKKRMEVQLVEISKELQAAESRYAELTSRPALEQRLDQLGSDLIPIPSHRIVSLQPLHRMRAGEVRTVSNRGFVPQ